MEGCNYDYDADYFGDVVDIFAAAAPFSQVTFVYIYCHHWILIFMLLAESFL